MSLVQLRAAASIFSDLSDACIDDAGAWERKCREDDSQLNRRAYVRAAFAAVEATTFGIRQFLLHVHALGPVLLEWPEVAALSELTPAVAGDGSVKTRTLRLSQVDILRMTFALAGKVFEHDLGLDFKSAEWQTLERAFAIRDRLVHPKRGKDYEITDAELSDVRYGMGWFLYAAKGFLDASEAFLVRKTAQATGA